MTTYKPRKNESNQVKYLRFLAKQLKNAAPKAKSDILKEYLLHDSNLCESMANFLSVAKETEQVCPEALEFFTKQYNPNVIGMLDVSASMKLILINSSIPEKDKELIKRIDEEARKYSKTLGHPYVS